VPAVPDDIIHAYYRFYASVRPDRLADGWSRDRIVDELMARGVPCYQGSCSEVYLENAFDGGFRPADACLLPANSVKTV
jgi:dTDP-4-amino-4,6-dideoxygalactose transaminase